MRRSMMLAGIVTLLTGSTATATALAASSKATAYVPRNALLCERASQFQNAPKHCKKCNSNAKVGAAEKVTVQIGGCGINEGELTTLAEFTATGVEFYEPVKAPHLEAAVVVAGELTVDDLTVGGLTVTGTSTHEGLETFNGGIAVDDIQPTSDGDAISIGGASTTVIIPGELTVDDLTVGDLTVTGTSTHEGLETFNGDIATDTIYSTNPDSMSVQIPGSGPDSTQIGPNAVASGDACPIAIGENAQATDARTVAIGCNALASYDNAVALGPDVVASGEASVGIGLGSQAVEPGTTAVGPITQATGGASTALGVFAYAGGAESVSIGPMAWASGDNSVAIGNTGDTDNTRRELLGKDATRRLNPGLSVTASGQHSVAIGSYPQATGNYSIALGESTEASGDHGVAIGPSYDDGESYTTTRATDFATIAIGTAAAASNYSSTAIGFRAAAKGDSSNAIGFGALTGQNAFYSTALGFKAKAQSDSAIVLCANEDGLTANDAGFYVSPIRDNDGTLTQPLYYDVDSGEITYDGTARRRLEEATEARIGELEAQVKALTETVQKLLA